MWKILGFSVFIAGLLLAIAIWIILSIIDEVNGSQPLFETWNQFSAYVALGLISLVLLVIGFLLMRGDPTGEP